MNNCRKVYLDILRIVAFLCVMFNHTGDYGYSYFSVAGNGFVRELSIIMSNLCKIGVPLFFMVSGALLIPKDEDIKQLLKKRLLRMIIVLMLFSLIYYIRLYIQHPEYGFSLKFFIQTIYQQPFVTPFWFLYMYIAFIFMLPLLRKMAVGMTNQDYKYFLAVIVFFDVIIVCFNTLSDEKCYLNIPMIATSIIYPLFGHYISNVLTTCGEKLNSWVNSNTILIFLILANELLCLVLTFVSYRKSGELSIIYIEELIFIPTVCVFCIAKNVCERYHLNNKVEMAIIYIGSCTFTVYLFEEMLRIDLCMRIYDLLESFVNPIILFIPYAVCMYSCGILIASIIRRIPYINKLV